MIFSRIASELKPTWLGAGSYDHSKFVTALEAILIEVLEPRQNWQRGKDRFAYIEYLQKVD